MFDQAEVHHVHTYYMSQGVLWRDISQAGDHNYFHEPQPRATCSHCLETLEKIQVPARIGKIQVPARAISLWTWSSLNQYSLAYSRNTKMRVKNMNLLSNYVCMHVSFHSSSNICCLSHTLAKQVASYWTGVAGACARWFTINYTNACTRPLGINVCSKKHGHSGHQHLWYSWHNALGVVNTQCMAVMYFAHT
jgi:hypothetical protein